MNNPHTLSEKVSDLILSIVTYVNNNDGYVNKTKLIKFLYLIDIEYYKLYGKIYTGFNWIFYKFGPYTNEFESYYDELSKSDLNIKTISNIDYDCDLLQTKNDFDLDTTIKDDVGFRLSIKQILNKWSKEKLAALLDYVYFETEPMESPIKKMPLDFSTINRKEKKQHHILPKGKISKKHQKNFENKLKQLKPKEIIPLNKFYPIEHYGDNYWEDLENFDLGDDY